MVKPCLDNLSHQMSNFLLNQEDPFTLTKNSVGKSSLVHRIYCDVQRQSLATGRRAALPLTGSRSTTTRSLETVTVTNCTVDSAPKSVALTSSLTSVASNPAPLPQWHTSDLDQMLTTEDYDYGFDLPCDYIECKESFHAAELEPWIEHSISHFYGKLPAKAICPFCDDAVSNDKFDLESNWRSRMYHIFEHLQSFVAPENQRPDYFLLDHMWKKGLLNNESYRYLTRFTERPYCPNLVPFDYGPPESILKRERNSMLPVDLAKEYRLAKKSKLKGKTKTHTHYGCATGESTRKLLPPSGESRKTETRPTRVQIRDIPYEAEKQENDVHSRSYGPGAIPALQKNLRQSESVPSFHLP